MSNYLIYSFIHLFIYWPFLGVSKVKTWDKTVFGSYD